MALPNISIRKRTPAARKRKRTDIITQGQEFPETPAMAEYRAAREEELRERQQTMLFYLARSKGNVAYACKKVGVSRMTHYRWLKEYAEYATKVEEIAEGLVDSIESLFIKTMSESRDLRSMRWFLERKGKDRGYGKPSVGDFDEGDGGAKVQIGQINVSIRQDVPDTSLVAALRDIMGSRPALMSAVLGPAAGSDSNEAKGAKGARIAKATKGEVVIELEGDEGDEGDDNDDA